MDGTLALCTSTSLALLQTGIFLRGTSEMGFLWTPFSLLLLLLREPACPRTQDHLSCPGRGLGHHPHQPIFGYPSPTQAH